MAQKGRIDISVDINNSFPTNNIKAITATILRAFEETMKDSHFNLIDDDAYDIFFSDAGLVSTNIGDALVEVNGNVSSVLINGGVYIGDLEGPPSGNITVTGGFTSCFKTNYGSGGEATMDMVFPDVGSTNYQVILNIVGLGSREIDNDIKQWVLRNKTSSGFQINIEESQAGGTQDLQLNMTLIATT
jgi:hypothetical protein